MSTAEASLMTLRALNPNVQVSAVKCNDVDLSAYDVVIVIDMELEDMVKISAKCRPSPNSDNTNETMKGPKLYYIVSYGLYALWFEDLGKHNYTRKVTPKDKDAYTVNESLTYVPLHSILTTNSSASSASSDTSDTSQSSSSTTLSDHINRLRDSSLSSLPSGRASQKMIPIINTLMDGLQAATSCPSPPSTSSNDKHSSMYPLLRSSLHQQIPAVSAVVGGIVAQDALKVVSKQERPYFNMGLYEAEKASMTVVAIGAKPEGG